MAAKEGGVKSATRVFEVLELFDRTRAPMNVSEIARELDYPISSTLMLLRCMQEYGHLTLDEVRKAYMPSPRLSRLTTWVDYAATGIENVSEIMEDLRAETGETVSLSAEQGLDILFLRILQSKQPVSLSVREGSRAPLEGSTIGLAILATKSDDQLAQLLDRIARRPERDFRVRDIKPLMRTVATIRSQGIALGYGKMSPEIGALAVALPRAAAGVTYALSIGGPRERIEANEAAIRSALKGALARTGSGEVAA